MDDYLCLNIPMFQIKYKKWKKYGYEKNEEKENLKKALNRACKGYCMYCYSRIEIDKKWYGNLEHAIEKNNSDKLIECIPNIGMACPTCNQSFKRIGEQKRKISTQIRERFEEKSKCTLEKRKQCTVPCKALRLLQEAYSEMEEAEIILQPMGILGKDTREPLRLQYDVLKMEFLPNTKLHNYSEKEKMFIKRHIQRFHLNDPKYRTKALLEFIKNVIDGNGILPNYEFNNLVVRLFADRLQDKSLNERLTICSKIYPIIFLKG